MCVDVGTAAWTRLPLQPKPANKSYSIKDYGIKEALSWCTPQVLSLQLITHSSPSLVWISVGQGGSVVIWMLTALYMCLLDLKFKTCGLYLQYGQVQMVWVQCCPTARRSAEAWTSYSSCFLDDLEFQKVELNLPILWTLPVKFATRKEQGRNLAKGSKLVRMGTRDINRVANSFWEASGLVWVWNVNTCCFPGGGTVQCSTQQYQLTTKWFSVKTVLLSSFQSALSPTQSNSHLHCLCRK